MNNTTTLGGRPTNPREISFDRSCFIQDGETVEYAFPHVAGSIGYAKSFTRIEDAQDWARRTGQSFSAVSRPVMRRVSWV